MSKTTSKNITTVKQWLRQEETDFNQGFSCFNIKYILISDEH